MDDRPLPVFPSSDSRSRTIEPGGALRRQRSSPTLLRRSEVLIALICALASLILYAATTAPSVATLFDDSLEFQVVLPTLGIAHPSGYPLYTLLGKFVSLIFPVGDPAGRINLLSALAAAAAMGVFYSVAHRLAGNRLAALVGSVVFAISPAWWSQATIAEVYAPHGLILALFLYFLLRWEAATLAAKSHRETAPTVQPSNLQPPTSNLQPPVSTPWLSVAALTFGLGLAHHRMIALFLPAALVFFFWTDPTLLGQPRRWLRPILLGLAPLLLYLYLPIRGRAVGSLDGTYQATLSGTANWILARDYGVFLTGNPFGVSRNPGTFLRLFLDQFGVLPLLAALPGLISARRIGPRRYLFLLLATGVQIAFGAVYKVADVAVFLIPAFMLVALWMALGLAWILQWVAGLSTRLHRRGAPPNAAARASDLGVLLVIALLLAQPIFGAIQTFPQQDRSEAWRVYDYGQDMLNSVEQGGQVIGLLGETTLLRYFRDVLGQRPDVAVFPADDEGARFLAVDDALAAGVPVYLTRDLPGAAKRYSMDAAGPLIAVSPKASPASAPAGQPMGENILLVDAHTALRQTHAGPVIRLTLTWAAAAPVSEELKVSARLLDGSGQVVAVDDRVPVHFTYPTTAWVPGELVTDVYDLAPGVTMPGRPHSVLLLLYRASDGGEVGRIELPEIRVPAQ